MLFAAFLITILFTILGWYISRDVFSPFVVQPGVWAALLLLYYVVQPDYYPIIHDFPIALALWCVGFFVAGYATYGLLSRQQGLLLSQPAMGRQFPSQRTITMYLLIAVLLVPFMLIALIRYGLERGEVNLFLYIRMASTVEDFDKPEFGVLEYLIPLILISLIFVFVYVRKRRLLVVALLVNVAAGFITMSKTSFFMMLVSVVFILHRQKRIHVRTIGLWMLCFLLFSVWFQYVRSFESQQETFSVGNMIALYTMSPCVAFDYYAEPVSADHFGEHVFRFFYAVMHALGSDIEPAQNIMTFVGVPELTNTYTVLFPFYTDFGLGGVLFFGMVYGTFFTFLYKRSQEGNNIYLVLYAYFLGNLVLQFVQENLFANFSLLLQSVFFIFLPYLFGNRTKCTNLSEEVSAPKESLNVKK